MEETRYIAIPFDRYEELVRLETRADVVVERITHDNFIKMEDVLRILGTAVAVEEADRIKAIDEKDRNAYIEKCAKE